MLSSVLGLWLFVHSLCYAMLCYVFDPAMSARDAAPWVQDGRHLVSACLNLLTVSQAARPQYSRSSSFIISHSPCRSGLAAWQTEVLGIP